MAAEKNAPRPHCDVKPRTMPVIRPDLEPGRASAIRLIRSKWVNGTVLHYHFLEGPKAQRDAVRNAFAEWKGLGIGLEFVEVDDKREAEIRIAFANDGSWSYVGRDVLGINVNEPTMNFGWDLTDDYGRSTALHEIGHTLGMPHEHQNPFAGIVWDDEAVYRYFGGAPNNWPREQTFHNVLRKLDKQEVEGSKWDPSSVMEYWFPEGLIVEPAKYSGGLNPPGGLSPADKRWMKKWFPALRPTVPTLKPFASQPLSLSPGQQVDYAVVPEATRKYQFRTFGAADTVMVLFEEVDGELRYVTGDDDSGEDRNATFEVKMFKGRRYVVRLRLYWAGESGDTAVMYW
jgi:Astacin (Peptidase family M12A)